MKEGERERDDEREGGKSELLASERDRRRRGFRVTETGYHFLTEAGLVLPQVDERSFKGREREDTGRREGEGQVVTNRADDRLVENLPRIESEISVREPDEGTQAKLSVSPMCRKLGPVVAAAATDRRCLRPFSRYTR